MLRLAVDAGGTFTDICLFDDEEGSSRVGKVSFTKDSLDAVLRSIGEIGTLELMRRPGVVLDWGTGDLLPKSTEGYKPCSNGALCPVGQTRRLGADPMGNERSVPFGEMSWTDDAPGIQAREAEVEGTRWAIVEYEESASRDDWCEEGHRGYVVAGEIEYEFDDGREPLRASAGEAFLLPPASLGSGAHRGRNTARQPTRLFLIDG